MNNNKPVPTVPKMVQVPEEAPQLSVGLVVRLILYVVVLINAVADMFGLSVHIVPDENQLYEVVTAASVLIAFGVAMWKNHDISKLARVKAEVAKQVDKL